MSDCVCSGLLQELQWQVAICQIMSLVPNAMITMTGDHTLDCVRSGHCKGYNEGDHMSECVCSNHCKD